MCRLPFYLGRAYQVVADTLKTPKTQIDPSIYISRFANTLDFGDSTHEVAEMATRLVKRMGRDWIDRGRRPTGLCGAALFIAARAKSFTIQFKDLERVAKIGHATIRKRLDEFECTDSATVRSISLVRRRNLLGSFEKSIFGRKFHSKNLKNDQISAVEPKVLNALYFEYQRFQRQR